MVCWRQRTATMMTVAAAVTNMVSYHLLPCRRTTMTTMATTKMSFLCQRTVLVTMTTSTHHCICLTGRQRCPRQQVVEWSKDDGESLESEGCSNANGDKDYNPSPSASLNGKGGHKRDPLGQVRTVRSSWSWRTAAIMTTNSSDLSLSAHKGDSSKRRW